MERKKPNKKFEVNNISKMAVQAKTDRSIIPKLWLAVERLVRKICLRYYNSEDGTARYEFDDLMQESYIQFEKAICAYDPKRGCQFSSFLVLFIPKAAARVIGYGADKRYSGEQQTDSINIPLRESEELSLEDTIVDNDSDTPYRAIEDADAVSFILEQVEKVQNEMWRYCFLEYAYKGQSMRAIADGLQVSKQNVNQYVDAAARSLRRNSFIKAAYPERYQKPAINPYAFKGLSAFRSSFSSIVEEIAEQREFVDFLYG